MTEDRSLTIRPVLSNEEYKALLNLVDLGVKAGGLGVATAAAVLLQKFGAAEKAAAVERQRQSVGPAEGGSDAVIIPPAGAAATNGVGPAHPPA